MIGYAGKAKPFFMLVMLGLILGGCSASKPKSTDYHIYSEADSLLNRDAGSRPLSVVLYVYQLRDRQIFSRLTFEDFVSGKTDIELLQDDILQKAEIVILPGEKKEIAAKLLPDAKYIGMVAIYRTPAEQQWRYLVPAEQIRKTGFLGLSKAKTVSVRLHDCHMTIDGAEIDLIPGQKPNLVPTCPSQAQVSTATGIAP